MGIEFVSRYGNNLPNPEIMCKGPCEGMVVYPIMSIENEWKFIKCPDCNGTGKSIDNLPRITKIECQIAKH